MTSKSAIQDTDRDGVREYSVSYRDDTKHIAYLAQGPSDGQLLIFLHGWPAVAETWKHQLNFFAGQGYYAVAPDMPGYGHSSYDGDLEDYAADNLIAGLLAMLAHTGRTEAVWVGHDWGAGVASSLVATHPEVVRAMIWMTVPYKTAELGLDELLPLVNRTIYPVEEYPYGQWDYMKYYEESFERASAVFNASVEFTIKACYTAWDGKTTRIGTPSRLSRVRRDGGWFGGVDPDKVPSGGDIPIDKLCVDEDLCDTLISKFKITGFRSADAYYMNHVRNRQYNLQQQKNDGFLDMPCLFIEAKQDNTLDTHVSDLLNPMRSYCKDFSFVSVNASHWLQLERPDEVNAAISGWLVKKVQSLA